MLLLICMKGIKFYYDRIGIILLGLYVSISIQAQPFGRDIDNNRIVTNSIWDNWYGQLGVDLNLLFPYGHDVTKVFTNGKTIGVNIGVGKWFSPEFGGRLKLNWGNGIFNNYHAVWLRPYGEPNGNHHNGGFITFSWDILLNLHNLTGKYRYDRKWNISVAPRAGGWIDVGSGKGCPLLGIGFINTYRLSDRWRLFADVGYHFVASVNGNESGTGHGSNGYAEINVGVEMDLSSKNKFYKMSNNKAFKAKGTYINTFWDNWFVQTGLGMSLQNPYGTNFSNVFPNGNTYGMNLGIGKWFTPDIGVRAGLNWQNGIIINNKATYLQPRSDSKGDPNKHSFASLYLDMLFNLHNAFAGYDKSRRWNSIIYPRMGIATNTASEYQECPVLGVGTEQTYNINGKWKLFADLAYQVVTSGFHDKKFHTPNNGLSSNGWFDISVGVQYELGKNWWDKPGEEPHRQSQEPHSHNWPRFIVNTGASVVVAFGAKTALKGMIKEERPDHSDYKSFPSGHAAIAFAAARSVDKEFGRESIWIPIAGYTAATAIGVERVVSDKHHWYDVVAGAALGFGSAELTWWLSDIVFKKHNEKFAVGFSGNTVDVAVNL